LWWVTLVGTFAGSILMVSGVMGVALAAAFLFREPVDPPLYVAFLANAPLVVSASLLIRARWQLGFLLSPGQRALALVCALVGYGVAALPPRLFLSLTVPSITVAATIGLLAALAPRRYRAPV
jgi:hypothetical protein